MKVIQIMKPECVGVLSQFQVKAEWDILKWPDNIQIDPFVRYDVTDCLGAKIGEISGRRLSYLIEAQRKLNLDMILDALEEGVAIIDENGVMCYANSAYGTLMNIPLGRIVGKSLYDVEADALILQSLKSGQPLSKPSQYVKSAGKTVSVKVFPIRENTKILGAFSIFHDVTTEHRLTQEVQRISSVTKELVSQMNVSTELSRLQIVGQDAKYQKVLQQAITVASTDVPVLIRGENGTGKELFAKLLHNQSTRKNQPFITVNCAAIPETLIESELFGYEDGAFTGSKRGGKIGKFQLAENGTLFLDEIGDMPLSMQVKLLRVLQTGEIEKIGREKNISVNVRVIAATNQPLEEMIQEKRFRQDLYYRLNVVSLWIPPLRQRGNDILLLANHFLETFNRKHHRNLTFDKSAYHDLLSYSWPGNIRELENCIERSVIMGANSTITSADLHSQLYFNQDAMGANIENSDIKVYADLQTELRQYEQKVIQETLKQCGGDKELAILKLGISKRSFYRKLK